MARNYKQEYQKFQSSPKAIKNRTKLNKINRKKGTYGNGDNKDVSHMKGGNVILEDQSKNRGNGTRTPGDRRARGKKPFTANMGYNMNKMAPMSKPAPTMTTGDTPSIAPAVMNTLSGRNKKKDPLAMDLTKMFNIGGEVELPSVEVAMPEVNMPEVNVPEEFSSPAMAGPGNEVEMERDFMNQQESISRENADNEKGPISFNDDEEEGPGGIMERMSKDDEGDETFLPPDKDVSVKGDSLAKDTMKFMGKTGLKKKVIQPAVGAGLGVLGGKTAARMVPGVGYGLMAADALPIMLEAYGEGHDLAFGPSLDAHEAEFGKESRDKLDATTHAYGVSGPGTGFSAKYEKGGKFPDLTGDGKTTRADILKGRGVFKKGGKMPGYRVGGKIRY